MDASICVQSVRIPLIVSERGSFLSPRSEPSATDGIRVAVLVPCHNEEATVARVVRDFRAALPDASVYVYDNASTDGTARVAREAGALVRSEPLKGKGNVVRRMFADVDADIYVLVDGDATYDAASVPVFIERLRGESLDMVSGRRVPEAADAYRPGHRFGNALFTAIVARIFGNRVRDVLSGYRVLSRRFVKSFPGLASGFEIEVELTIHALELRMPVAELPAPYSARPSGSGSKLHAISDGLRILRAILSLVKEERPLFFFGAAATLFAMTALVLAYPVFLTYFATGLVPRFPTAILSASLMILAFLSLASGFILDTVTRGRREMKRMQYLTLPAPRSVSAESKRVESGRVCTE
jgi:glycosyltransferase involved in cell wall biosynthesis